MAKFTLIAFIVFFFPFAVSSQITITGNTNICLGDTAVLTATPAGNSYGTTNYVFETIDFNTHPPFSLGTVVDPDFQCTYVSPSGHDDCYAPLNGTIPPYGYPIGFSFCFFNQQYDHFWVGSNGWIGFTNPTGQNWTTYVADTIPNTAPNVPKNCIFAPWQDWFPGSNESGNDVYYYTLGSAPDRKLVVYWKNCPLFLCQQGAQGTYMIVLNEQSSIIENFIQNKPQCPSSTEGATQGVQNLPGTVGYTATGRNYKVWTASNEGTRFKPSGITWYKNFYPGGPQVGYGEILKIAPAATTTYFAVVGNCDGTIASNSVVVTVNTRPAPTFVSGATTACQNDVKTYTTQAGGNNYSWLYTGLWVAGGGPNDDFVTIQWGAAGSNTVSVNYNNAAGCRAVNPTILNVTVNQFEAPVLTTSANQYCADQTLTFTTQAGKSSYIWTYPLPGATLISGGTSTDNTLVVKWSTPGLKTITVNYTDAGCTGDPPASKQVTIIGLPLVNGPFSTTICSGTNTAIMLTSTPAGAVFGWNSPPPGCSVNIASCPAGVASGTLISDILTLTDNNIGTVTYHITPTLSGCPGPPQNLAVNVAPIPTVNPVTNQVACHNTATSLVQFSGNVPGTLYSWTNSNTSIGLPASGSGDIASFTATNITNSPVTATIVVSPSTTTAGATCTGTTTSFTITVNPVPAVDPLANQVLCHLVSSAAISFSGNVTGTIYNWTNSNPSIGLASGGSGDIASFTATNPGTAPQTATITVTPAYTGSGNTCTGIPASFTITVNPLPAVNSILNQVLCHNTATELVQFSGPVPGTVYNWTNSNASIGLAAAGSGDISSFTATNLANVPVTATITVTPAFTNAGVTCTGTSSFFTVTVNPVPAIDPTANQVLCHLAPTAAVNFSGNVPGTLYSWVNSSTSIGLAASGSGNISSFTGTNTGTTPQTATITVTPSFSNSGPACQGIPTLFTITVNPIPTVNAIANQVLCQNTLATQVLFSGNVPGTTFSWTNSNTAIGLASGGSGDISAFTATNSSTFPITATISVTPSYTFSGQTCTGSATSFSIIVNPLPTVNGTANQVLCHLNSTAAVAFSGTVPGTVYNWVNSNTSIGLGPSGAGNISAFTATNSTASPVTATITVTPSFTNANVSCTGAVSVFTYTVNPLPQPIISGPASVCLNIPSTDTTEIFQSGYTWNIVSGGIITSGQTTNKVNVLWNTLGIHSITVNYTDQHGCTALVPASKQVTVSALPSPAIAGAATVCAGDTKTYKTLAGASSYTWGVPSSGINVISGGGVADDSVTIQWNTSGTYNISVNYVISSGCTAASPSNYSVTVNALPFPQITGPAPVCAFSTHNYTVSPIIGGHFYNWTVTGGTILSGQNAGTVQVSWGNSSPGSLGLTETINYPGISCPASAVPFPVVLNPWPGAAGSITGQNSVCKTSVYAYSVPAITNATTIQWQYSGSGVTIANNGNATITITFTSTATSGALTVHGINNCGNGPVSQPLNIAVHELPGVSLTPCFDLVTTTNAKKIVLRGGTPWLSGQGVYSGNRVNLNALTGFYEFDPTGATAGSYSITYTYTNTYGCLAAASVSMTIQNNPFTCGGTLTDVRDSKTYKTAYLSNRCWMAENLSHGTTLVSPGPVQTDNCIIEKYCSPGDAGCTLNGGKYQWDELMDYIATPGTKGICPPEWHVPTEAEWQSLIDNLVTGTGAPDANALSASSLKDVLMLNGFQALFGGLNYQNYQWAFSAGTLTGSMFWTSTPNGNTQSIARGLNNYTPSISRYSSVRSNAFPVRCIKD